VDTAVARSRLASMLDDLDRSIDILRGEGPEHGDSGADAGAVLSDHDRVEAALAALERIDAGTYGLCADCGEPIPEGRLEARPDAARCISCQSRHDRRR